MQNHHSTDRDTTPRRPGWRRLARLAAPAVALAIASGAGMASSAEASLPPPHRFACEAGRPSLGVHQDGRELAWTSKASLTCNYLSTVTKFDVQAKVHYALHPASTPLIFITSANGPFHAAYPLPQPSKTWATGNNVTVPFSCVHGKIYTVSAEAYVRYKTHGVKKARWSKWYPAGEYPTSGVTFSGRKVLC